MKTDLKITDNDISAELLQIMWNTLDFLNVQDEIEKGGKAVNNRFITLQNSLKELYLEKRLTTSHIKDICDYMRKTLFIHLNLFIQCMRKKQ